MKVGGRHETFAVFWWKEFIYFSFKTGFIGKKFFKYLDFLHPQKSEMHSFLKMSFRKMLS